jgi:hypothetical protein
MVSRRHLPHDDKYMPRSGGHRDQRHLRPQPMPLCCHQRQSRLEGPGAAEHPGHGKPLLIAYGADELPELRRQSEEYAKRLRREATAVPEKNHFTILEELASPHGALTALARRLG